MFQGPWAVMSPEVPEDTAPADLVADGLLRRHAVEGRLGEAQLAGHRRVQDQLLVDIVKAWQREKWFGLPWFCSMCFVSRVFQLLS